MVKWFLLGLLLAIILADYNPVNRWVTQITGKSPYEWGYIAGKKTREFFTDE